MKLMNKTVSFWTEHRKFLNRKQEVYEQKQEVYEQKQETRSK